MNILAPLTIGAITISVISKSVSRQLNQAIITPLEPNYDQSEDDQYIEKAKLKQSTINRLNCYIKHYSFGSCGPRGFLGTFSPHVQLEIELEKIYKMSAVLYSCSSTAIQSALQSVGCDTILILNNSSINIKRLQETHKIVIFDINSDLNLLKQQVKDNKAFIVVDSHDLSSGFPIPNDPQVMINMAKFLNIRILWNETLFPFITNNDFDMVSGCFNDIYGISCGFVCGARVLVEGQRYGGLGYCFSASSPPCLIQMLLDFIKQKQILFQKCKEKKNQGYQVVGYYCKNDKNEISKICQEE